MHPEASCQVEVEEVEVLPCLGAVEVVEVHLQVGAEVEEVEVHPCLGVEVEPEVQVVPEVVEVLKVQVEHLQVV